MTATEKQRMTGQGPVASAKGAGFSASPTRPDFARGACPSLEAPMATGDGLLVRLRPSSPGMSIAQWRNLAHASMRHGNGLMEVTARGNIQLRGLSAETMPGLAEDLDRARIVPETGLVIETPPLSGRDPAELADARSITARLREMLPPALKLAPKLSIIVDGRGTIDLDTLSADIRLVAITSERWELSVGGTRASSHLVCTGTTDEALIATTDLLKSLHSLGPRARGRDLAACFPLLAPPVHSRSKSPLGLHDLGLTGFTLGVTPRFGQISADRLLALLDAAALAEIDEIRTAPGHALLLLSREIEAMDGLRNAAIELGFDADCNGPFRQISSCSGAGACASATFRTKDIAAELVEWVPGLFDGSATVHVSGCPKGCAHPGAASIGITGLAQGYGLALEGRASDQPLLVTDKNGLKSVLQRLAALVRDSIAPGESVKACLERLGSDPIAAALRQE